MIIDFTVNFNNYREKILNNYSVFYYICPKCGAKHSFTRHGSYERNISFIDKNHNICEEKICILRLKCSSCDSTHAILSNDVIPYCIYSASLIIKVLSKYYSENNKISNICSLFSISFQLIYSFISKFIEFLTSSFSVLRNLGYEIPRTPHQVISAINLYNQNNAFLYIYIFKTQWIFLMRKFHNILAPPIFIGSFYYGILPPT
jgi:hypothetical protein